MPASDPKKPSQKEVQDFHTYSDKDGSPQAQHHSLGAGADQAAPGNHSHDGGSSKFLLEGVTLTGAKAGNTALASVINALVTLGATDSTT